MLLLLLLEVLLLLKLLRVRNLLLSALLLGHRRRRVIPELRLWRGRPHGRVLVEMLLREEVVWHLLLHLLLLLLFLLLLQMLRVSRGPAAVLVDVLVLKVPAVGVRGPPLVWVEPLLLLELLLLRVLLRSGALVLILLEVLHPRRLLGRVLGRLQEELLIDIRHERCLSLQHGYNGIQRQSNK